MTWSRSDTIDRLRQDRRGITARDWLQMAAGIAVVAIVLGLVEVFLG